MKTTQGLFDAKLEELAQEYALLAERITALQDADPDEVRRVHTHLEAEWADTVVDLKNRARAMRFFTGQQLSQVQLEYCRRAADILHESVRRSWAEVAGDSEADDTALYAEYAIDFATMAMRHALLAVASAIDVQNEENTEKDEDV